MGLLNADWLFSAIYPSLTWSVKTNEPNIYLTFDDGPIPELTDYVLEELDNWGVKATFFCVGENILKHPKTFKKIVDAGHSVGNHTYNHLNGWKTNDKDYFENILKCQEQLNDTLHAGSKALFRPPYGKIKRTQLMKLREKYQIVMWNVLTRDYDSGLDERKCLKDAIKSTKNGSIVVFHDNIKAEKNLKYVLPRYIEYCLSKGFVFKKL